MWHVGLTVILLCLPPLQGPAEKGNAQNALKAKGRTAYLVDRLSDTVDFAGFDDPRMTLQDALEYLTDRYDLSFNVDENAFAKARTKDNKERSGHVLSEMIAQAPVSRMRGVSLQTVIAKILAHVDVASGATYLFHKDQILITTQAAASHEILGDSSRELPPLVHRRIVKRLLGDALDDIADATDVNVVLDESVGEKAKETVTARFLNTPVETAVRVLANRAGLSLVRLDNVLYVTTREKAVELRADMAQENKFQARRRMPRADEQPKTDSPQK